MATYNTVYNLESKKSVQQAGIRNGVAIQAPFGYALAQGVLEGESSEFKFGADTNTSTTSSTVWDQAGDVPYLTTATQLKISSSSANDTSGGTGARQVRLFGLDGDYNEVDEEITLNGQTAVTTTNSYLRLPRMQVFDAGSGGFNDGVIYAGTGAVTAGVPTTVYSRISAGINQTQQAFATVPNGKQGYITQLYCSVGSGKQATVNLFVRPFGEVFQNRFDIIIYQDHFVYTFQTPLRINEKSDVEIRAKVASATGTVTAGFELRYSLNNGM